MADEASNERIERMAPCPECQTGVLRLQYITYFTWLSAELISVPNFPAWVCDVCGLREYDVRAVKWLNTLLNPEAGHSRPRLRRQPPRSDRLPPKSISPR
jgi:YgiT-type zinc finger domain-containing protein